MERFVCVHGHFYQPPRENPWLEAIEIQDSAAPFHDWNARIQAECYAPNGASRIRRDYSGPVVRIVNNYRDISFNFGPTLLSWMERADPEAYGLILAGDRWSVDARGGHGNAIAQAYNHLIMPLASARDQATQVAWGAADFRHRFGRDPEGMWLPETAADLASLRALAKAGIKFTILSPYQAARVRPLQAGKAPPRKAAARKKAAKERKASAKRGKKKAAAPAEVVDPAGWKDVRGGGVDPTQAYRCDLGDGLSIDLFFYDGPLASGIAFQGLLADGAEFGRRLLDCFASREGPQLVNVATDGETYGHHHRHGDMALAAAIQKVHGTDGVAVSNYAEFLARFPPVMEVEIVSPSAWSCAHGVGRWSRDCGCSAGTPGHHHRWRQPLRESLDRLKDGLDALYQREASRFLPDPWAARDGYIDVVLDGAPAAREAFLATHGAGNLTASEAAQAWSLLEMQRHGMLMFTSCGWFFDEISGLEGVQILRYAKRALQLAARFGGDLEAELLAGLAKAPANNPHVADGAAVMREFVQPSVVDPDRILARHAIATCLDPPATETRVFCYSIEQADFVREATGHASVAVGRVRIVTETTQEEDWASYAVVHFGEHDFSCKVHRFATLAYHEEARDKVLEVFRAGSLRDTVLALEECFPGTEHDVRDLFLEERRTLMTRVLEGSLERLGSSYRRIFNQNRRLMEFLAEIDIPVPEEFAIAAGYVVRSVVHRFADELLGGAATPARLGEVLEGLDAALAEAKALRITRGGGVLEDALQMRLERETATLARTPRGPELEAALLLVEFMRRWGLEVKTWRSENAVFRFLQGPYEELAERRRRGEPGADEDLERARRLADLLGFAIEE